MGQVRRVGSQLIRMVGLLGSSRAEPTGWMLGKNTNARWDGGKPPNELPLSYERLKCPRNLCMYVNVLMNRKEPKRSLSHVENVF